jgi:HlyD family secretion protein
MEPDKDRDITELLGLDQTHAARHRARRLVTIAVGLVLVIGLGFWFFRDTGPALRYQSASVARGDLTVTVTATGTVEPTNEVEISSELSGIIREVKVDYNDQVTVGQILAELDTDKLEAQVAHSKATLAARVAKVAEATAGVAEKKSEYQRILRLQEKNFSSQQDLDVAKAAYDAAVAALASARSEVDVARADLELNETNLKKACICSPINGVVLSRNVEPGQTVASSLQAPVLFRLAEDLAEMKLEVDIDEADMGKVREGQQATFTVEAFADLKLPAEISELRYAPETVEGVVTYKAVLSIDNSRLLLRPGMTATADITVQQVSDALLVPNAALRCGPPEPKQEDDSDQGIVSKILPHRPRRETITPHEPDTADRILWVLRDGEPVAVSVTTGATDGTRTQILSGELRAGDKVIVDTLTVAR